MLRLRSRCRSVVGRLIRAVSRRINSAASIGPNDHGARPYKQFGNGSIISWPTGNMYGERWISIGENTMIAAHVTLSAGMVPDQQMMTDPVVIIGDRCLIGRGSSIVGHYRIDIGDDVYTGMNVYITDQNHGYEDLEMPIGIQVQEVGLDPAPSSYQELKSENIVLLQRTQWFAGIFRLTQ